MAIVSGEITTRAYGEIPDIVRKTINAIGYDRESMGFDGNTCGVMTTIDPQSPDIAQGVDKAFETRIGERDDEIDAQGDRKSVGEGKRVSGRLDLGGRRIIKNKNQKSSNQKKTT